MLTAGAQAESTKSVRERERVFGSDAEWRKSDGAALCSWVGKEKLMEGGASRASERRIATF